jgi:hypothetical protein
MALKWCSVADASLTITATQNDAGQTYEDVYYGGIWITSGGTTRTMLFRVLYTGDTPGLYYWPYSHATTLYNGVVTVSGGGTLVKAFTDGSLTATLRFVTSYDAEGHGSAEMFCDGVSVQTYTPASPVEMVDLVSCLYISGGAWNLVGDDSETMHVGPITATVWEAWWPYGDHYLVKVNGGAPTTVATATRTWPAWVAFIQAGGDEDDYSLSGDLYASGTFNYYTNWATDENGFWYENDQSGQFVGGTFFKFCKWFAGVPAMLSFERNPVADCVLACDCGLSAAGDVGVWQLRRQGGDDNTWSEREAIAGTAGALTANLISGETGTVLVEEIGGEAKIVPATSFAGDFGTPVTVESGLEMPFGIQTQGRYGVVALDSGNLGYYVRAQDASYSAAHSKVDLYPGTTLRTPVVARHANTWRLYAAAMGYSGDSVSLLTSSDSGLSWQHANVLGQYVLGQHFHAAYPYLWVDRDYLWLLVYRDTATAGAPGQCVVYQFHHEPELLDDDLAIWPKEQWFNMVYGREGTTVGPDANGRVIYSGVVIGPSDEGRSAVVRDPLTWRTTVIVPKSTVWTDTALPTPGIVEYTSENTGRTWSQKGSHAC